MKKKILLAAIFLLLTTNALAYEIQGNSVIMEDADASLKVTPHTAVSPVNQFEQEFVLCNKTDTGRIIYSAYIFEEPLQSGTVKYWLKPEYDWVEQEKTCDYDFNYSLNEDSDQNPHRAWCFEEQDINGTLTNVILWEQEFKTGDILTATIQFDVNELVFGNKWFDITDSYTTNHQELNGKHIYPNIAGNVFLPHTCNTWKIKYKPSDTDLSKKWDLWLWSNTLGWRCILTDSCQKTLKLDPWWNSDFASKYPINDMVIGEDLNATNWISIQGVDLTALNFNCSDANDMRIVNEPDQVEVTDFNIQGFTGNPSTDSDVNILFKLTEALAADTYNGEYYLYTNNSSSCSRGTVRTPYQTSFDDFEDGATDASASLAPFWFKVGATAGTFSESTDAAKEGDYGMRINPVAHVATDFVPTGFISICFSMRSSNVAAANGTGPTLRDPGFLATWTRLKGSRIQALVNTTLFDSVNPAVNNTWYNICTKYDGVNEHATLWNDDWTEIIEYKTIAVAQTNLQIFRAQLLGYDVGAVYDYDNVGFSIPTVASYTIGDEEVEITDSCTCPAGGHWEIINGDFCTLIDECKLIGGNLHIVSGNLHITSTGILTIPSNYIVSILDGNFNIEKGGVLSINK